MQIKLSFFGAAGNVTGSRHLIEVNGLTLLVDCGMFQEWQLKARNWQPWHVRPRDIDAVLLTHAHLDHSGLLPKLVHDGFEGPIHCTEATAEIAELILLDSAHLLQEDAEFKKRRHRREGRASPHPYDPLYTSDDARDCATLFSRTRYGQTVDLGRGVEATFYDAGHTLGSAMIQLTVNQKGARRTILFSGDIGKPNRPIIENPTRFTSADYVVMESTYGNRVVGDPADVPDQLADIINDTRARGGNIIIPSFALERSQELLYHLNNLLYADRIPHLMVFLDSPLAIGITQVFKHHPELFDRETNHLMSHNRSPFDFPGLRMTTTSEESKTINHISGTVIIIAGSGMCSGGRIKHHLVTNITRADSTILFVGYQAQGTLGRQIVDGASPVRILGQSYKVKAKIVQIDGFSGHADQNELLAWVSALKTAPRHVFVSHGEVEAARHFAGLVKDKLGWLVSAPVYEEQVVLN